MKPVGKPGIEGGKGLAAAGPGVIAVGTNPVGIPGTEGGKGLADPAAGVDKIGTNPTGRSGAPGKDELGTRGDKGIPFCETGCCARGNVGGP